MYSRDLLWPPIPFIDQQSHHQYQDLFDHHQTQLQPHSIPLFPMPPMENLFFHEYSYDQYGSRPLMNHIEYQSPENFIPLLRPSTSSSSSLVYIHQQMTNTNTIHVNPFYGQQSSPLQRSESYSFDDVDESEEIKDDDYEEFLPYRRSFEEESDQNRSVSLSSKSDSHSPSYREVIFQSTNKPVLSKSTKRRRQRLRKRLKEKQSLLIREKKKIDVSTTIT